jgi:hypothetical protein
MSLPKSLLHAQQIMLSHAATVQQKSSPGRAGRRLRKKKRRPVIYEPGDDSAGGDSVVPAGDSVVAAGDSMVAAGLVTAVAAGGLVGAGVAAGSVVSVFCSHAARSAALARMQMYFFIVLIGRGILL